MTENVTRCPLCAGERSRLFDRREFRSQIVTNRLCLDCGLVYQSPRMTAAETIEFYAAEYRRSYQGDESPVAKDLTVQRLRARSLLEFVQKHIKELSRHLDIGSSSGLLLQEFHNNYECHPVGVEPGDAYRNYSRAQGLTIYSDLTNLIIKKETTFDLVSMAHVLEHLPNPLSYLADLRQTLLAPDGWLLLEVPNLFAHDCFETAHLVSYSPYTLAETVEKAGYKIVELEAHGRPHSKLVPYYLTLLARVESDALQTSHLHPERFVALKRRLGLLHRRLLSRLFPQKAWIEIF